MTIYGTTKSDHISARHKTVYTYYTLMSQPTNQGKVSFGESLLKIMILVAGIIALIGVPVGLYMVFQLVAMHMAFSDMSNAVSQSALSQIAYNVTHINEYDSMAKMQLGYGISMSNADNNIALFGLLIGFAIDVPIAILVYREYKELD